MFLHRHIGCSSSGAGPHLGRATSGQTRRSVPPVSRRRLGSIAGPVVAVAALVALTIAGPTAAATIVTWSEAATPIHRSPCNLRGSPCDVRITASSVDPTAKYVLVAAAKSGNGAATEAATVSVVPGDGSAQANPLLTYAYDNAGMTRGNIQAWEIANPSPNLSGELTLDVHYAGAQKIHALDVMLLELQGAAAYAGATTCNNGGAQGPHDCLGGTPGGLDVSVHEANETSTAAAGYTTLATSTGASNSSLWAGTGNAGSYASSWATRSPLGAFDLRFDALFMSQEILGHTAGCPAYCVAHYPAVRLTQGDVYFLSIAQKTGDGNDPVTPSPSWSGTDYGSITCFAPYEYDDDGTVRAQIGTCVFRANATTSSGDLAIAFGPPGSTQSQTLDVSLYALTDPSGDYGVATAGSAPWEDDGGGSSVVSVSVGADRAAAHCDATYAFFAHEADEPTSIVDYATQIGSSVFGAGGSSAVAGWDGGTSQPGSFHGIRAAWSTPSPGGGQAFCITE